jgi:hypothetical protein
LLALKRWRHYFLGGNLVIKTDQQSLKYMMSQRLTEGIQHKLLMKLLEFKYTIEYKKGVENIVADALSQQEPAVSAISCVTPSWITDVENSYSQDTTYKSIIEQILINSQMLPHYSIHAGVLRYKGRICVGDNADLKKNILTSLHSSAIGGHSGIRATYQRVKKIFHWPHLKKSVESFVAECVVCQRAKSEYCQYPGLLEPLPIPDLAWTFISMDFVAGHIQISQDIFALQLVYHPQTDGQTERVNQCLKNYLRCMAFLEPKKWVSWMSLAEWWYNITYHTSLKCSPFEALYGYHPPLISEVMVPGLESSAVDFLQQKQHMLTKLRDNLTKAQQRSKKYADRNRSDRVFNVGDMVYLKLQPYRQCSWTASKPQIDNKVLWSLQDYAKDG